MTLFAIANYHWPICWMICFIQFVRLSYPYWSWRRVIGLHSTLRDFARFRCLGINKHDSVIITHVVTFSILWMGLLYTCSKVFDIKLCLWHVVKSFWRTRCILFLWYKAWSDWFHARQFGLQSYLLRYVECFKKTYKNEGGNITTINVVDVFSLHV